MVCRQSTLLTSYWSLVPISPDTLWNVHGTDLDSISINNWLGNFYSTVLVRISVGNAKISEKFNETTITKALFIAHSDLIKISKQKDAERHWLFIFQSTLCRTIPRLEDNSIHFNIISPLNTFKASYIFINTSLKSNLHNITGNAWLIKRRKSPTELGVEPGTIPWYAGALPLNYSDLVIALYILVFSSWFLRIRPLKNLNRKL